MNIKSVVSLIFLVSALLPACSKPQTESTGSTSAAAGKIDEAAAKEIYDSRCSACHGTSGKGDGPGSAALTPKPRDLADAAWSKSVTDDHLRKIILSGGAAVGKSPMMPPNPDLDSKPEVVEGLVKKVRSFSGG